MPLVDRTPTLDSVLEALTRQRPFYVGRVMGAGLRETRTAKATVVHTLGSVLGKDRLPAVLRELGRNEL